MRKRNQSEITDEFEVVGAKKTRDVVNYETTDDDDAIPNVLVINIQATLAITKNSILQAFDLIPEDKRTVIINQNIDNIKMLFGTKADQQKSQWRAPK